MPDFLTPYNLRTFARMLRIKPHLTLGDGEQKAVARALDELADIKDKEQFGDCWNCIYRRTDGKPCVHTQMQDPAGCMAGLRVEYCCDKEALPCRT